MSEKVRRVGRWVVFAAVWLAVGLAVGVLGAGSDPTVGTSGIKNFPWVNATSFKFTGELWRGSTNLTGRLLGSWDVGLSAPTLDTGQGANELYPMDQAVRTSDSPTFDELTLSGDLLNGYNVTEALKYPEQPASYIIFTDGSMVYAKNGTTGEIEFSGTDAATVIQSAEDSANGLVFIAEGTYIITYPILIKRPTFGAGIDRTILRLDDGIQKNVIEIADYGEVHHLTVNGNYQNNLQGESGWTTINDVPFAHGIFVGRYWHNNETLTKSKECIVSNVKVIDCLRSCIAVDADDSIIKSLYLKNSYTDHLLYMSTGDRNIFETVYATGIANAEAIVISTSPSGYARYCSFRNLKIFGLQAGKWGFPSSAIRAREGGYGNSVSDVTILEESNNNVRVQISQDDFTIQNLRIYSNNPSRSIDVRGGKNINIYDVKIVCSTDDTNGAEIVYINSSIAPISGLTFDNIKIEINSSVTTPGFTGFRILGGIDIHILNTIIKEYNTSIYRGVTIESGSNEVFAIIDNVVIEVGAYVLRITQTTNPLSLYLGKIVDKNNTGYGITGSPTFYRNSGIATIASGTSSVVVDHGLVATPSVVKLTGTHSEVASPWVTNVTATQFTINVAGAVTADRDVYWYAVYEP